MKVPEFPCADCTVNTCGLEGSREYYEVHDEVWHAAGAPGIGQSDNGPGGFYLCIGCLEKRLDRELNSLDFKRYPANISSPWLSLRLNSRLRGFPGAFSYLSPQFVAGPKINTPMFYPNALTGAIIRRFKPEHHYISPTGSYAIIKMRHL